jgi:hypothetical protein
MYVTKEKYNKCKIISFTSLLIIFVIAYISIVKINSKADDIEKNQNFSDDTIVTKDNVIEVLNSLNIKHVEVEKTDSDMELQKYTVGELKSVINRINNSPKEIVLEDDINEKTILTEPSQDIQIKKDSIINKKLTRESKKDGYTLEFYVDAKYNKTKKKYIETTGQGVDIDGYTPLLEYKIGSSSLFSSCTSSTVTLKGKVKINVYIGVAGMGLVKIRENEIKVTYHW